MIKVKKSRRWAGLLAIILAAVGITALVLLWPKPYMPIPLEVKNKLNFTVFYPDPKATDYKIDKTTVRYDSSAKVLFFTLRSPTNSLVFTEQATPDPFNDIPQYWDAFTGKLQSYTTFDSIDGKVALTHPVELKGGQAAVFNGKGTFMFIHPAHDLSDDTWRQLFNAFQAQK